MIFFSWHKKFTYKLLRKWKISKYTAMWISFVEGLLMGAIIVYYFNKYNIIFKSNINHKEIQNMIFFNWHKKLVEKN